MNRRVRLTIDSDLLAKAKRYAKLAHMTDLSGLVAEALEQHMRRYPREGRDRGLEVRMVEVEKLLGIGSKDAARVLAGTSTGSGGEG